MTIKYLVIPIFALGLIAFFGAYNVYAQEGSSYPMIVQKLAERFGLDPEEINAVFAEQREQKREEMQVRFEQRLEKAAVEGNLTEEQKQAILAKKAEMQERFEELKDLAPEQRREAMKELHQEMRTWLKDNGIDLRFMGFMAGIGGFRKGFNRGFCPGKF